MKNIHRLLDYSGKVGESLAFVLSIFCFSIHIYNHSKEQLMIFFLNCFLAIFPDNEDIYNASYLRDVNNNKE